MHPSVHQRFAAINVDTNGKLQPYRPHNLRNDARFTWYYGGTDPNQVALEQRQRQATYEVAADSLITFVLGKADRKLAAMLSAHQATSAVGIFPGDPNPGPDTAYLDAMALDMLAKCCCELSMSIAPLRRLSVSPLGAISEHGLVVMNLSDEVARTIARNFGATTLINVNRSGECELRSLML